MDDYLLDSHTHTLASGHAYGTIEQMVKAASERGLKFLGITEHAPMMPGSCQEIYFSNFSVIPRMQFGVELALGVELNILNERGEVDLPQDLIHNLDVVIASFHIPCYQQQRGIKNNTRAVLRVMENPDINIIGHPDDGRFPLDYQELVRGARETGKLLELNNSSLRPGGFRQNTWENASVMLQECMKVGQPIIVDSDAHWMDAVGTHQYAQELMDRVEFPQELVLNYDLEKFKSYINKS